MAPDEGSALRGRAGGREEGAYPCCAGSAELPALLRLHHPDLALLRQGLACLEFAVFALQLHQRHLLLEGADPVIDQILVVQHLQLIQPLLEVEPVAHPDEIDPPPSAPPCRARRSR